MKYFKDQEYENTKKDLWALNLSSSSNASNINNLNTNVNNLKNNITGENLLINGDFKINQRGLSSYTTTQKYTVDRWVLRAVSATVQTNGIKLQCVGSGTGGLNQSIENFERLYGKTLTLSIKIRAIQGTWELRATSANHSYNYSNVIAKETLSTTGVISKTFYFDNTSISTYPLFNVGVYYSAENVGDYLEIEYIKLEVGNAATSLSPRPYSEELRDCQRYYVKCIGSGAYSIFASGMVYTTSKAFVFFPLVMRTSPTLTSGGTIKLLISGGYKSISSMAVDCFNSQGFVLTINGSGYTAGNGALLSTQSDSTAYLAFDSEIN